MKVGRCTDIAPFFRRMARRVPATKAQGECRRGTGFAGPLGAPPRGGGDRRSLRGGSKIPHDEILEAAECRLHRTVFLGYAEAAQARQAGFFEQAHDGGGTGLRHHV